MKLITILLTFLTLLTGISLVNVYAAQPEPLIKVQKEFVADDAPAAQDLSYDYNGDGLVGIADCVILLRELGQD